MMKPNFMRRHGKKVLLNLGVLLIFLLGASGTYWTTGTSIGAVNPSQQEQATVALPPIVPWTAVASTGVADESTPPSKYTFTEACIEFTSPSPRLRRDSIEFRYNVVNTFDNGASPTVPGWTNMELGFKAPGTSEVVAALFRVNPCNGQQKLICSIRGVQSPNRICWKCSHAFPPDDINFATYLYYVDLKLKSTRDEPKPEACTLRLFRP